MGDEVGFRVWGRGKLVPAGQAEPITTSSVWPLAGQEKRARNVLEPLWLFESIRFL
jgi:hypothetical protein